MCVFCKIINGDIPSYKIYEDENVFAFLDINPVTYGHTLVIPKKHVENIFELDSVTTNSLFVGVTNVAKLLKEKLKTDNLNLINNNGPLAYQSVFHYHVHLIPRYENDSFSINFKPMEITKDKLNQIHQTLTKQ